MLISVHHNLSPHRNVPQAPPVSKTPPASENSSLGSSGESNYETPTSSPPKEDTIAALQSELAKFRQKREKIRVQLDKKKVQSDMVPSTDHNVQRLVTTSVITRAEDAPSKKELMKRSPKKARFHPDTIIEEVSTSNERTSEMAPSNGAPSPASNVDPSTSGPPAPVGPETFCPQCGNRVTSVETHCSYCRNPVSFPLPSSSGLPPPIVPTDTGLVRMESDEPKSKPLRASAASTEEAIQHHRRTQAFPAAIQRPPVGDLGQGLGEVEGASGGINETGVPMGVGGASGAAGQGGSTSPGIMSGASMNSYEKSYKEIMAEKLEYWKAEWRKRGYTDDEIPSEPGSVPLPPPKEKKPPQPPPSQPKKRPKVHYDPSRSTTDDLERYRIEEQRNKKMAHLAEEGKAFIECVKVCSAVPHCDVTHSLCCSVRSVYSTAMPWRRWSWPTGSAKGRKYSSISGVTGQEASGNVHTNIVFLLERLGGVGVWCSLSSREVQQYVAGLVDGQGRSVGIPSDLEARKYLALNDGNVLTASHKIYAFRKKKVSPVHLLYLMY